MKSKSAVISGIVIVALAAVTVLIALPKDPGKYANATIGLASAPAPEASSSGRAASAPPASLPPSATLSPGSLTPSATISASVPTAAAPSAEPSPTKTGKPDKAVIIFTFDDGALSDYLLAYPILKKYGIKGTSYLITKFTDENMTGKMTWDEVREMSKYGWVFGCHTYDHRHLTSMSDAEIKKSMELVNESFEKHGFPAPEIMAYPYGGHNQRVIDVIKKYRKQARDYTDAKFVDLKHPHPYDIPCVKANMQTKDQLSRLENLVDKACKEKAVVVFCLHVLYKDKPADTVKPNHKILSGSAPQSSSKLFAALVDYCAKKDCAFMDMKQLMDFYQ